MSTTMLITRTVGSVTPDESKQLARLGIKKGLIRPYFFTLRNVVRVLDGLEGAESMFSHLTKLSKVLMIKNKDTGEILGWSLYAYGHAVGKDCETWHDEDHPSAQLYVKLSHRGKGYGKLMMDEIISLSKKQKVRKKLEVFRAHEDCLKYSDPYGHDKPRYALFNKYRWYEND